MTTAPVLDTGALGRLGEELGDQVIMCAFVRRYAEMLDRRVDRVQTALTVHDREAWHDAALSLKTSSTMAGAAALSELMTELLEDERASKTSEVPWFGPGRLAAVIEELHQLAAETEAELRRFMACKTA